MRTIYSIGETTYDIIFKDNQPTAGVVGGSALNAAVSLGRAGLDIYFLSRFGNDLIGNISENFLKENHVNCDYIKRFDGQSRIALAFLDRQNNARYQFYQSNQMPKLSFPEVKENDFVLFGSLNALNNRGRNDLIRFLKKAAKKKAIIVYDPNIRNFASSEKPDIIAKVEENIRLSTIIKGSTEDFTTLYGNHYEKILQSIVKDSNEKVILITNGKNPVRVITHSFAEEIETKEIETVSTIGAGDNFNAGVIYGLHKKEIATRNISSLSAQDWRQIVHYGSKFAANVCSSTTNYISNDFAASLNK
jgi:fructokinase